MSTFIDLTGQRFGKWAVLGFAGKNKSRGSKWYCRCICGRERIVNGSHLRNGASKSCRNCHARQQKTTHDHSRTRLYRIWVYMISRCENLNCRSYKNYGGRGISVCPEWRKDFMVFREWALSHGYEKDLTIDRINNDGDYEPGNCQFLTRSENSLKAWHIDGAYAERNI